MHNPNVESTHAYHFLRSPNSQPIIALYPFLHKLQELLFLSTRLTSTINKPLRQIPPIHDRQIRSISRKWTHSMIRITDEHNFPVQRLMFGGLDISMTMCKPSFI